MTYQHIIRSYYWIAGVYTLSASLIWGINTLFLLQAGLNIAEVFAANAAFTAGMVIFEIPTGIVADTLGRRMSFLLSAVVLTIATLGYVAGEVMQGGLAWFVVFSVLLGLGFTFYSGAVEAWLVDALKATGYSGELDSVFARGAQITGIATLIGSTAGGFIGSVNLAVPYVLRAILLVLAFIIALRGMHDIGYQPKPLALQKIPAEMKRLTRDSIQFGFREPRMRLLMLAAFIQFGFTSWAFYAWQPYFLALYGDPNAVWIAGIVMALMSGATIAGNMLVDRYTRYDRRRTTWILGTLVVFTLVMTGVGLTSNFYLALVLLLVGMAANGAMSPVRQSYIHHVIPADQRASVLSVDNMAASAGGIVGQSILGQLSLTANIGTGYVLGGLVTILCLPPILLLRSMGGAADNIIGSAGRSGGQAGQGLPPVAAVDTTTAAESDISHSAP